MTEMLIRNRESWRSDIEAPTVSEVLSEADVHPNLPTATHAEVPDDDREVVGAMVEDLPRSLVDAYVERATHHARVREIEPGTWFASVAGLEGAWGDGKTADNAMHELAEALTGWVAVRRRFRHDIPAVDGIDLNLPSRSE